MATLAEKIKEACVQALAHKAKRAEEIKKEKELAKAEAQLKQCYQGLCGEVLAFIKAEKFLPNGSPLEGVTTHDLKLAFPGSEVSSLRWCLWKLRKHDLVIETDQMRQPERGRAPLTVWKAR